jgi:16S rRNA (cytidine1402-2'-O)-methyltransferase
MPGRLFIVSTPIGNLGDLSQRAVETLRSVRRVLAEDTRHSRHLLDHFAIETRLEAYHEHNEARATPRLIARLMEGDDLALISDAGTPLLSDPGARLVGAAIEAGIPVIPVPGASAVLAALVVSGFDIVSFTFVGFLARKGKERKTALRMITTLPHTSVLYEAPSRVAATLAELDELGVGGRRAVVARELTKQFEEVRRGTVAALARYYLESPPRGEVVMVLEGGDHVTPDETALKRKAKTLRATGMRSSDVVRSLVEVEGIARNLAYRLAHED